MRSNYYQNFVKGASSGTVQKNLNAKGLTTGLPILIPKESIINNFNTIILSIRKKIKSNLIESQILTQIRDTLLPKLITGKIRINLEDKKEG